MPSNDDIDANEEIEALREAAEAGEEDAEEPSEDDVIMQPDGSALIVDPEGEEESDFLVNLAEKLPDGDLNRIAEDLLYLIDIDKESRKKRDELYEEGLRRTGLGDEAPGGAQFEGASRAVHPVLAESCVDYAASAIKELFPADGPVKIHNFSEDMRPDDVERAEGKRDFMNWQLVELMPEYRSELEILLTQQPLGGSQYMKIWWDTREGRPCAEFIPIDQVYLPFAASSFASAGRVTVVVPLTKLEYKERVRSELYIDAGIEGVEPQFPEQSAAAGANDRIEGKSDPIYNEDGLRNFYEVYVTMAVEDEEGDPAPYIITIDEYTRKIVAIYRNWEEGDELQKKLDWVVDFTFIPWRGAYGIGLTHLIGSLSGAATGALRALLDSAHLSNFPGAIKLKGARASGQNVTIGATEVTEIEAPANIDDIRKVIMPLPFNQPSPTLFQLLGWLTDAAKGVVSTAEEKISDATNQMPVGTAMALIEQGSKVFSAIHARLHRSQQKILAIIQRLNHRNYNEEQQVKKFGRVIVTREEFLDTGNVIPVSDPNIFSEAQRFSQIQGVLQMSQDASVPWNKVAIYKRMLRLMHVEAPQEFLPEPPQPVSADPVTEIVAAMNGQQVKALPEMDHTMHMREQLAYLNDPVFGAANPSLMNPGFSVILQDVYQHLIFTFQQYKQMSIQGVAQQLQAQLAQNLQQMGVPPEEMQQVIQQQMQQPHIMQMVYQQASQQFEQARQQLAPLVQAIQSAAELVKQKTAQQQQMDPASQAALQITQMQEQTKAQIAGMRDANEKQRMEAEGQMAVQKLELEKFIKTQIDPMIDQMREQNSLMKNREDNMQKQQTEVQKNDADNRTQILINEMRNEAARERAVVIEQLKQMSDQMNSIKGVFMGEDDLK